MTTSGSISSFSWQCRSKQLRDRKDSYVSEIFLPHAVLNDSDHGDQLSQDDCVWGLRSAIIDCRNEDVRAIATFISR